MFSHSLHASGVLYLKTGQGRFLPDPFQFTGVRAVSSHRSTQNFLSRSVIQFDRVSSSNPGKRLVTLILVVFPQLLQVKTKKIT